MPVKILDYGSLPDGRKVELYRLTNAHGMTAEVLTYGAHLVSLAAPDRDGEMGDVTLGFADLDGWRAGTGYLGATVGRFANRIAGAKFELDGKTYQLAANEPPNHLHGGEIGFNKRLWNARPVEQPGEAGVELTCTSPDGEEGYPGTLETSVVYTLTDDNELRITFSATTDKPTIVNLVHHTYWNLSGDPSTDTLDHELVLHAERYLPVDEQSIPTGDLDPVEGTAMDFRDAHTIGQRIAEVPGTHGTRARGYDHCWVLRGPTGGGLLPAAEAHDPKTGRVMELLTDQPGVQFYAGLFLDGSIAGKRGVTYHKHAGFCLETENFPDSPNKPQFPSPVLRPGDIYTHTMVHRFSAR